MTQPKLAFTKATRQAQKLKIAVAGPSGSGKTFGAIALAHQLASDPSKVAVLDTENESSALYSDRWPFDILAIRPPYLSSKYLDGIEAAIAAGYEVLVIDSITHQWDGDGGILQRKEEADCVPGSNHWTNWKPFTAEHNEFRAALLNAPLHIICTMRSKQAYQQTENGSKKRVEKLGLQPIQRDGMEYEFTLTFDVDMLHKATTSKDRTKLFDGKRVDLADAKTAKALLDWMATAAPLEPRPAVPERSAAQGNGRAAAPRSSAAPAAAPSSTPRSAAPDTPATTTTDRAPGERAMPFGNCKGKKLSELSLETLESIGGWCREKDALKAAEGKATTFDSLLHDIDAVAAEKREAIEREQTKLPLEGQPTESLEDFPAALASQNGDDGLPF